jgi:hypothetical protein
MKSQHLKSTDNEEENELAFSSPRFDRYKNG